MNTASDVKNRVCLISGGTSGVGKATAMGLAELGAKVVIISRSLERGRAALTDIARATGNDRGEVLVADLTLQASVRQISHEFKRKYDHLHVLANLSGALYFEKQLTADGIERMFAVNYLSHFLLTHQLRDILKASRPARVMTVAGAPFFFRHASLNFADIQGVSHFNGLRALTQAMFARVFFTFELAQRLEGTGVTAVTFHPGWVKSELTRNLTGVLRLIARAVNLFASDRSEIAVYVAAAQAVENVSAAFFDAQKRRVPFQFDENAGRKLWSISEELTSVSG